MMPILRNKLPDIPDLVVCPHCLYKWTDFAFSFAFLGRYITFMPVS
ncbi:hypothetical protein BN4901_2604 [Citrobacter europaeus]|uniref:Uncharacterized protein n=1 Tax=Citrobacter europaeus TaxID=1914243 RepID=A0ABY0JQ89_9ENTR|nr:hypothetical protein CIP106467_3575 [Citrobacter europaeus]SBW25634.1 hypothetical protein BN4901_2604 [Citrobacter europaeus]